MKDNKEGIIIILVIFVLLGFAYKPIQEQKKKEVVENSTPVSTGYTTGYYTDNGTYVDASLINTDTETIKKDVEKSIEESKRSPYYGKITISYISSINNPDPSLEYMYLYTNIDSGEKINITGWYFKSDVTGYFATIGKASLLPFPYKAGNDNDIILQKGDSVIINKGFSPIGVSFRTNACVGYFEENRTFNPSLNTICPRPIDGDLPTFSTVYDREDECLDVIQGIPSCTTRGNSYLRNLPDTVTQTCKDYIKNQINYESCVAKNYSDPKFPGNEYRIYLNKFGPLWRDRRETVRLYDKNNLIVDTIKIY